MEKTILYSKKPFCINENIKSYEKCEHEHCKQLMSHIKFLSNMLTQNLLKEQLSKNIPNLMTHNKQNILGEQSLSHQLMIRTLQEQMETVKKNYLKLKKQLSQVQLQNDELFQENQQLKKKVQRLSDSSSSSNTSKDVFELSLTKCQQNSANNSKSSFYCKNRQQSCEIETEECSKIQNDDLTSFGYRNQLNFPHGTDIDSILVINSNRKSHFHTQTTDRSQIYSKYQILMRDYKNSELERQKNSQKLVQFERENTKLVYENKQLKKIIMLRNQIQSSRHNAVRDLKNVVSEILC